MATQTPRNAFWNYSEDLEDPRDQGRNSTYSFESVVVLAVMGICCEYNSLAKIALFLTLQWKWFAPYFPDHDGPPSRSTF
ncbi:MAG: transposase family protein, partial [Myxococcales bacterium]|nr:transposase family protein [Myxococcales bacterium]